MRSRRAWEIVELNDTKTRPRPTCDQLTCDAMFGDDGSIALRSGRMEKRRNGCSKESLDVCRQLVKIG
jgi:hypothetical protein